MPQQGVAYIMVHGTHDLLIWSKEFPENLTVSEIYQIFLIISPIDNGLGKAGSGCGPYVDAQQVSWQCFVLWSWYLVHMITHLVWVWNTTWPHEPPPHISPEVGVACTLTCNRKWPITWEPLSYDRGRWYPSLCTLCFQCSFPIFIFKLIIQWSFQLKASHVTFSSGNIL